MKARKSGAKGGGRRQVGADQQTLITKGYIETKLLPKPTRRQNKHLKSLSRSIL